jgi:cysteine-rich repeat protein
MDGTEACDDGNQDDNDGCSNTCERELGWDCSGEPSLCEWVGDVWISISAGSFDMGSPIHEEGRSSDEMLHQVTLTRSFEISAFEVTQADFDVLMGYNPAQFPGCGQACPVNSISWHEAALYCNALSFDVGFDECYSCTGVAPDVTCELAAAYVTPYECSGYRLPTEAEWEYAARAGTSTATYNGDLDADHLYCEQPNPVLDPIAWFCGNSNTQFPHSVGGKDPNPWGIYDILGNVYEWCHDGYADYPAGPVNDPLGPETASHRVMRGGYWEYLAKTVRSAFRWQKEATDRYYGTGFRPVRTLP